jgi:hypothetical protein
MLFNDKTLGAEKWLCILLDPIVMSMTKSTRQSRISGMIHVDIDWG